jgi:hypothetical protein
MGYDASREAKNVTELARDDLKTQSTESASALMREIHSIPNDQLRAVQAELNRIGNLNDPNSPEVRIQGHLTQTNIDENGRQKTVLGVEADGVKVSGEHYEHFYSYGTEDATRIIADNNGTQTLPYKSDIFSEQGLDDKFSRLAGPEAIRRVQWSVLRTIFDW